MPRAYPRALPEEPAPNVRRPGVLDLAVLALATQHLTRLVSKDSVTAPLRVPFTEYEGEAGEAKSTSGSWARACATPQVSF